MSVWCVPYTFRHSKDGRAVEVFAGSLEAAQRTARIHLAYLSAQ